MFGINKYLKDRKQEKLREKINSMTLFYPDIISTLDAIFRGRMPKTLEYMVKNSGPYQFRVSKDCFINNTYVFVIVGYHIFELARMKEFMTTIFDNDKIIVVSNKVTSLLKTITDQGNIEIIEVDTLEFIEDNKIKDLNYLINQLQIKI